MTHARSQELRTSPWPSIWLRPRDTIERILVTNPRHHVLLLAVLTTVSFVVSQLIAAGYVIALFDWRIIAIVGLGGAAYGITSLYYNAFLFRWTGKLLGGHATAVQLRAVLAWSSVPHLISLAICLIALVWLELSGGAAARDQAADTLLIFVRVIIAGIALWSFVVVMLVVARTQRFGFWRTIAAFALFGLLLLAVVILVRTLLLQPFKTPSGAMEPTLLVGDEFFVSKISYGYSRYSLPFSPRLFSGRLFASEPQRGDVVVFRLPSDDSIDYVKRLIGLPGDRVQLINGLLHINGQPVAREPVDDFVKAEGGGTVKIKQWRETLPNGVSFTTLKLLENGFYDNTPVYSVPPGHYFMMGDNRDNSTDSRVLSQVGYVPFENLVGRVAMIFFSAEQPAPRRWPTIRSERIGMRIE
jgi:signal peptidase I